MSKIFDEQELLNEIVKTWGEHGAHAEVYKKLLAGYAEGQGGARWVKSSERLPGWETKVKWRINGEEREVKQSPSALYFERPVSFLKYEWYDEQPESTTTLPEKRDGDFFGVLEENYQAQIAGFFNDDKTDEQKAKRNAVIEEYKDLIEIYKSGSWLKPVPTTQSPEEGDAPIGEMLNDYQMLLWWEGIYQKARELGKEEFVTELLDNVGVYLKQQSGLPAQQPVENEAIDWDEIFTNAPVRIHPLTETYLVELFKQRK